MWSRLESERKNGPIPMGSLAELVAALDWYLTGNFEAYVHDWFSCRILSRTREPLLSPQDKGRELRAVLEPWQLCLLHLAQLDPELGESS